MECPEKGAVLNAQDRLLHTWLATGWTNARIAARLGLPMPTVTQRMYRLYAKLGCANRVQAAIVWHGGDVARARASAESLTVAA